MAKARAQVHHRARLILRPMPAVLTNRRQHASWILPLIACTTMLVLALVQAAVTYAQPPVVNIGSKRFTESYILGEILTGVANRTSDVRAVHKPGLGNTGIVFAALRNGAIDLYAEYTGTIAHELLKNPELKDLEALSTLR